MARILDCWELGNGLAYIEGLAVGAKLFRKAGHEVSCAFRDLSHAERIFSGKFPLYQAPTSVIPMSSPLPSPMTFADVLINLGYGSPDAVTARVRAWRNLIDLVKPDLVRCAHSPGALLAVRGTGIRTVVMGIGFLVPPNVSPLPLLRSWAKDAKPERMAAREQMVLAGMNQGLDAIGAPRVDSIGALYNETDTRQLYTYAELDEYGPRDNVRYLGNLQAASGEAPVWPNAPGKRIFAYLDAFKPIPMVLETLAKTGLPVLVFMPHAPDELKQRYASGNLKLTDRPLNLVETTQRCDFGVSHGGHNIVASLLQAGKPQLSLPTVFPERVTAEKISALGAGVLSRMDPQELTAQLAKLLQDSSLDKKAKARAAQVAGMSMEAGIRDAVAETNALARAGRKH